MPERATVTIDELPITAESRPFMSGAPLPAGYVEREFVAAGSATLYDLENLESWEVRAEESLPYRTRFMVRYPTDPARFNGTVVLDWLNITAGFDLDAEWLIHHEVLSSEGFAYVGVTVHSAGTAYLRNWNPDRYAGINIEDDGQSWTIYADMARLVRERAPELLGGLAVERVIGTGASQSAWRLATYIDFFHQRNQAFDGYLVRGRGFGATPLRGTGLTDGPRPAPIRLDVDVPVMILQNEGDLIALKYLYEQQEETPLIRVWEVAGAAHGSPESTDQINARMPANGMTFPPHLMNSAGSAYPDVLRIKAVGDMALRYVQRWVTTGEAPPTAPRLERASDPGPIPDVDAVYAQLDPALPAVIARDEHGNARGGVRLPDIDAPVGQLMGSSPNNLLGGEFLPFSLDKLAELYPTKERYVEAVRESALRAEAAGWIDSAAAKGYVDDAEASDVPNAIPAYTRVT